MNPDEIKQLYIKRQSRAQHPSGKFDRTGRWYPNREERRPCCAAIRPPSRKWPYSLLTHCRTKKHILQFLTRKPMPQEEFDEKYGYTMKY